MISSRVILVDHPHSGCCRSHQHHEIEDLEPLVLQVQNLTDEFDTSDIPSRKTIERIIRFHPPSDQNPWVPRNMVGEDARLVLESMSTTEQGMGLLNAGWPTTREAECILWIRKSAPTLPAIAARIFAIYYLVNEDDPIKRQMLEWMIAYRIWEGEEKWKEYRRMVEAGYIPGPENEHARIYHCIAFDYVQSFQQHSAAPHLRERT